MPKHKLDHPIIGKILTAIYESQNKHVQEGIPGPASFFNLVIELNGAEHYEFGPHKIVEWDYREDLMLCENTPWAIQNKLVSIGQKIQSLVILDDDPDPIDNTLAILLENNVFIEHNIGNGDQLFIGDFETDFEDE